MTSKKKKPQTGVELVLERNAFYHDGTKRALLAILFLLIINAILAFGIVEKSLNPPAPQYFPTTSDGRIINWHPLSDPVVTDDFVLQWTSNAVRKAFSLDFEHWREQLQSASQNFTPSGWKYFETAMTQSNNLKTLIDSKMVSDAQVTGSPQIVQKEVIDGVFAWKIQMPILVTFTNASQQIPMPMSVTLIVLRVPVNNYPDRIAINNFLPKVQETANQELLNGGQ